MKQTELMIGDWVKLTNYLRYGRVKSTGENMMVEVQTPNDGAYVEFPNSIEPVLLTEKILIDDNGWEVSNVDVAENDKEYGFDYGEYYVAWWRKAKLLGVYRENKKKGLSYEMVTEFPIRYVHELQHVLRLMKIKKDIEIFGVPAKKG